VIAASAARSALSIVKRSSYAEKATVPETSYRTLATLLAAVRNCRAREAHLPLGARPVLRAAQTEIGCDMP
jgi:hypothetical protein